MIGASLRQRESKRKREREREKESVPLPQHRDVTIAIPKRAKAIINTYSLSQHWKSGADFDFDLIS